MVEAAPHGEVEQEESEENRERASYHEGNVQEVAFNERHVSRA